MTVDREELRLASALRALSERLEQAERERDEANDLRDNAMCVASHLEASLAAVPALVEAARDAFRRAPQNHIRLRDALAAYEQAQEQR